MNFIPFLDPVTKAVVVAILEFELWVNGLIRWIKYALVDFDVEGPTKNRFAIFWGEVSPLFFILATKTLLLKCRQQSQEQIGI